MKIDLTVDDLARHRTNPSTMMADSFRGVSFSADDDREQRMKGLEFFTQMWRLLEHQGWYDHTSDWDFHVGIRLNDGRENSHIGDGADVYGLLVQPPGHRTPDGAGREYAGEDLATDFFVSGPDVYSPDDNGLYGEEDDDQLKEFRTDGGIEGTFNYIIPVAMIQSVTFGYCT